MNAPSETVHLAHAVLGPSSIDRWSTCTASVQASKGIVEKSSSHADAGNLVHDIAEALLTRDSAMLDRCRSHELWTEKLEELALFYVDWVHSKVDEHLQDGWLLAEFKVEERYDLSEYFPESFGTSDLTVILEKHGQFKLLTVDLKSGAGIPVFAQDNGQLRAYSLGAYLEYRFQYPISEIEMWIVQPPFGFAGCTSETISAEELLTWAEEIKPKAEEAFFGPGVYAPSEKACQWCRIKNSCAARLQANLPAEFTAIKEVNTLTDEELTRELARADEVISYYRKLKDFAYEQALAGRKWAGFKLVEGKSTRGITDPAKAAELLRGAGYMDELIYERNLLGITALEKMLGKKEFETVLAPVIAKASGKPALVLESDKRPALQDASAVFGKIETGEN